MSDLGSGDSNLEEVYTSGEYVGLLLSRTHAVTGSFQTSAASYTCPVGKKLVGIYILGSDTQKVRLWNVTDGSIILPDSYFEDPFTMLGTRDTGVSAGDEIQLQSEHTSTIIKPTGLFIFRVVDA